jgi:hypothetical protein
VALGYSILSGWREHLDFDGAGSNGSSIVDRGLVLISLVIRVIEICSMHQQ